MRVVDLARHPAIPVLAYDSRGIDSAELAAGQGEARVHVVRMRAPTV